MNLLYGWDIIPDSFSVGGSTQGNANVDSLQSTYMELAQSLTANYSRREKLGAYTELFAFFPDGAQTRGFGPEYYFDGGFTC